MQGFGSRALDVRPWPPRASGFSRGKQRVRGVGLRV